jgi:hypothetical protein
MFSPRSSPVTQQSVMGGVGGFKNVTINRPLKCVSEMIPKIKQRFDTTTTTLPLYDQTMGNESTSSIGSLDHIHPPISSPVVTPDGGISISSSGRRRRYRTSLFFLDSEHRQDQKLPLYNSCGNESSEPDDCDHDQNRLDGNSKHRRKPRRSRSSSRGRRRSSKSSSARSKRSSQVSVVIAAVTLVDTNTRRYLIRLFATGHILQIVLLVVTASLVVHSHSRANFTANTLRRLQEEESMSLLQLQKIERQSLLLHENIRGRLHRAGVLDDHEEDPLEPQHLQLEEMTNELNLQVNVLQQRIQQVARDQIVRAYGEGPVKVVIELDFGNPGVTVGSDTHDSADSAEVDAEAKALQEQRDAFAVASSTYGRSHPVPQQGSYISILLWPDTPHAAWTWLEQIGRDLWDASTIEWDSSNTMVQLAPSRPDPLNQGLLEFFEEHPDDVENSSGTTKKQHNPDMNHGAWTVGLREKTFLSTSSDTTGEKTTLGFSSDKRLEMFINLSDNQRVNKHETCIGTIIDGFDALQRLLEATRISDDGKAVASVRVNKVFGMHITHRELEQVYS